MVCSNKSKHMNILIVDDSSAIRKILQRALSQSGIPVSQVLEAGDGNEALDILKSKDIQLVLSDVNMPNMDGLELLKALRAVERWKSIPVIMITTEASPARVTEALRLGASGYVRKPFSPDQIKEKLESFI